MEGPRQSLSREMFLAKSLLVRGEVRRRPEGENVRELGTPRVEGLYIGIRENISPGNIGGLDRSWGPGAGVGFASLMFWIKSLGELWRGEWEL